MRPDQAVALAYLLPTLALLVLLIALAAPVNPRALRLVAVLGAAAVFVALVIYNTVVL